MDRNFTEAELNTIINDSLAIQQNLLPYYCRENIECWPAIKRSIKAIKKHNIIPESFWHGNAYEFEWFLTLLSDGYPNTQMLIEIALTETHGEIKRMADHFYQHINVMFTYVKPYKGYVVLRPTDYMLSLHPEAKDRLFIYTADKWNNSELSDIGGVVLVISSDQIGELPGLLKKKLGLI